MAFVLGDHNDAWVQRYLAEFDTVDGPIELECWTVSPTDAAATFRKYFEDDHPYRVELADGAKLEDVGQSGPAWNEQIEWWRSKPVPTGDEVMLYINQGSRVNIEGTVIAYEGRSYLIWSCASVAG